MKKYLLLALLLLGVGSPILADSCNTSCGASTNSCDSSCNSNDDDNCSCPCGGKTFFYSRPMYQSYRPELWSGFGNDRMHVAQDGIGGAFDFVFFGSKSTGGDDLASYFLPNCNNCLVTREETSPTAPANLFAENFNIITEQGVAQTSPGFSSVSSFNAQQSVAGFGVQYKQGFLYNDDRTRWFYVDISSSVQHVKNEITIDEKIISDGGGAATAEVPQAVDSLTAALRQCAWKFGRINSGCPMTKTGLADIELKIGYEWWHDHCHFAGYLGALLPTGNKAKGVEV
ncbi:MAG: hypothetical protein P4L31_01530, partial [Candidatus Babeliales bacterium]|nr:hypothetical protein [Candidatus Babeliales bacterium]